MAALRPTPLRVVLLLAALAVLPPPACMSRAAVAEAEAELPFYLDGDGLPPLARPRAAVAPALKTTDGGGPSSSSSPQQRRQAMDAALDRGIAAYSAGRFAEAASHYAAVTRLAPRASPYWRFLGDATMALGQGRTDEALSHYASAVRADPGDYDARVACGT
eukprot:SAG22_NODE_2953_length_2079_cov_1.704545_1_plen_161_part_10